MRMFKKGAICIIVSISYLVEGVTRAGELPCDKDCDDHAIDGDDTRHDHRDDTFHYSLRPHHGHGSDTFKKGELEAKKQKLWDLVNKEQLGNFF